MDRCDGWTNEQSNGEYIAVPKDEYLCDILFQFDKKQNFCCCINWPLGIVLCPKLGFISRNVKKAKFWTQYDTQWPIYATN